MEDQFADEGAIKWERVIKILMVYASNHARQKIKKLADGENVIADGISPSDLMCEVITKFLKGEVPPNPAKPLTQDYLINLLKKAYRTDLLDLIKKPSAKTTTYSEDIKRQSKEGEKIKESFINTYDTKKIRGIDEHQILCDPPPVPDERLKYEEELQQLYDLADGDPQVQEMIKAICECDLETPREIAANLKTPVSDIYNRKKKLRKIYAYLRQSYQQGKKAV